MKCWHVSGDRHCDKDLLPHWQWPSCLSNHSPQAKEAPTHRLSLQEGQRQTERVRVCVWCAMTPQTDTHILAVALGHTGRVTIRETSRWERCVVVFFTGANWLAARAQPVAWQQRAAPDQVDLQMGCRSRGSCHVLPNFSFHTPARIEPVESD